MVLSNATISVSCMTFKLFLKNVLFFKERTFFYFKIFVGHMFIFGATDTPVSDFW